MINLDIRPFPNVNVVADAQHLPFGDSSFDHVFRSTVLEHVPYPQLVAQEISRVLRPGGTACIQSPFLEAIHDEHDYFRFTLKGLKVLFPELNEVKSCVSSSPSQVLADILRVYPVLVFEGTFIESPLRLIMSWLARPFQWLDFLIKKKRSMPLYARAFYFIGQKGKS